MKNLSAKKQRAQTFKFRSFKKYRVLYFMMIPALLYFIIFCYTPMYGILMAFKDYKISRGVMGRLGRSLLFSKAFFQFAVLERAGEYPRHQSA